MLLALLLCPTGPVDAAESSRLVLITLDTTRTDALGVYSGVVPSPTPALDALARSGLLFRHAITAAPLTLPAHASIFTGLEPPRHGVRDNATEVLSPRVPTLAAALDARGWDTAAFVGSRVLDRRFGLDRGFDLYDDTMLAEEVGEYGYPERRADAVVDRALAWLDDRSADAPLFLWVHVYDPHAPYDAPNGPEGDDRTRYVGEVRFVDRHVGRLLDRLRADDRRLERTTIAVVSDHGESLGEHGERTHGLLLHEGVLHVPLILAGRGVARGTVDETVATRRLAATLLALASTGGKETMDPLPGPPLPLAPANGDEEAEDSRDGATEPDIVYSETLLPLTAYGWSPLRSATDGRWRLLDAPTPALFDLEADPGETRNRLDDRRRVARRLEAELRSLEKTAGDRRGESAVDPELVREVAQLGYLSGWSSTEGSDLDPRDGMRLLERFEEAKALVDRGKAAEAVAILEELVTASPGNVPFISRLASALRAAGRLDDSITAHRRAVAANPRLEFLRYGLASALAQAGKLAEARVELDEALTLNPRYADAWLALAELADGPAAERALLERAVDAETRSAAVLLRLGALEAAAGERRRGLERLREATELAPGWAQAWLERSRLEWEGGDSTAARTSVERALAVAAPTSPEAETARRLLRALPSS